MSAPYSVSFSARLLLIVVGLVALVSGIFYLLPAAPLRYVGIYYAAAGIFNLIILPLLYMLSYSRFELVPLEAAVERSVLTTATTSVN